MNHARTCGCCGRQFNILPLDFACAGPDPLFQIPEPERQHRGKLDDVCRDIFVRGRLEIPIVGQDDRFIWGVWVSVSKESFSRFLELWDAPPIESEPPKFGWLCNNISLYPTTLNLRTHLHLRVEAAGHPSSLSRRITPSPSNNGRAFPSNALRKSLLRSHFDTERVGWIRNRLWRRSAWHRACPSRHRYCSPSMPLPARVRHPCGSSRAPTMAW